MIYVRKGGAAALLEQVPDFHTWQLEQLLQDDVYEPLP